MRRFLNKLIILSIPFLIIMIFYILIDPYNYFFESNFIDNQYKITSINRSAKSMPRGNMLWKIIDFRRHPEPNVIIGDSRAFGINERLIEEITHKEYYNFAVPGGNYNSLIETFWYVVKYSKPKKIYLQVGFHNYNKLRNFNLFEQAIKADKNPIKFFTEIKYTYDAYSALQYQIEKKQPEEFILKGKAFKDNWDNAIQQQVIMALNNYTYPDNFKIELVKIKDYCKKNNIELYFIIFPSHSDFHKIIEEQELTEEYNNFINDITSMGKTYNFEHINKLTSQINNYQDVYHLKYDLLNEVIINDIWKNKHKYSTFSF